MLRLTLIKITQKYYDENYKQYFLLLNLTLLS